MIKLLVGGSPCQHWSIAQKNNRETQPNSGIGWELFKNYLIAKEKFKPDYFLYENNVSAAQPIKDEIKKQLGVWDGTFLTPYSDVRYIEINSALVSAQNRERFYVHNCGEVEQPKDRGILLKDVLISGYDLTGNEKSYALTTRCSGAIPEDTLTKHRHNMVAEPVIFQLPHGYNDGGMKYSKAPTLTANGCWQENNKVIEPISIAECKTVQNALPKLVDKYGYVPEMFNPYNAQEITDKSPTLSTGSMVTSSCATRITEPVCLHEQIHGRKAKADGTYDRRYEARIDGKTGTLTPTMRQNAIAEPVRYNYAIDFDRDGKPTKAYCYADGKIHTVYEVKDGKITIKGKEYPIKLPDGFYIIRKLTVTECRRLQTIPDWYKMPCSATQNYKLLGNGWTVEVIKHILSHIPRITKEPIEVLSMYDGMSCARIALKELGANVVRYYATEIDKYAIQTTQTNFPDTIQLGDAFQVREADWKI